MGLSGERQDYLLDIARSLIQVHDENIPVESGVDSHGNIKERKA